MAASKALGRNWGVVTVDGESLTLRDDARAPLFALPLSHVVAASGGRANDVTVEFKDEKHAVGSTVRFFVPTTCAGFENEANPAKALLDEVQSKSKGGSGAGSGAAGDLPSINAAPTVGTFKEMQLSQPAGDFDVKVTTAGIVFTGKRGTQFAVKHSAVSKLYLVPVPGEEHKYMALSLATPVKVGAQSLGMIVLALDDTLAFEEDQPWESPMTAQQLRDAFPDDAKRIMEPKMHGAATDVIARVLKTATGASLLGDNPAEFTSDEHKTTSAVRAQLKANAGSLYLLKSSMLFLHRPATLIPYAEIEHVDFDTGLGASYSEMVAFTVTMKRGKEKHLFHLSKREVPGIKKFLGEVKKVAFASSADDDDEGEDEEDADDDDSDFEDNGSDEDEDDDDDGSDASSGDKKKKKKHKKEKSDKKPKKNRKDKQRKRGRDED